MLNEDQVHKLRAMVMMPGWTEVVVPATLNRGKQALDALTLSRDERLAAGGEFKDTDDAVLRAIIKDSQWLAAAFQNEIKVFDYNRHLEELQGQENGSHIPR